jgi:hypothetical protein
MTSARRDLATTKGYTTHPGQAAAPISTEVLLYVGVPEKLVNESLGRLVILLAERYGLDPALRHVEVITTGGKLQVYITADGWRYIADRSGELDGLTFDDVTRGEHGWRATAYAWRKGCSHPFEGRAGCGFAEKKDDPEAQAMTRATRRALRNAFAAHIRVPSEYVTLLSDTDHDADEPEPLAPGYDINPAATMTGEQRRAMVDAFNQAHIPDRRDRLAYASMVVGRDVLSSDELTAGEADQVLASLTAELEAPFDRSGEVPADQDPGPSSTPTTWRSGAAGPDTDEPETLL